MAPRLRSRGTRHADRGRDSAWPLRSGLGRLGQAFLFRLEGFNLPIIAAAAVVIVSVALLAGVLPARRAASVNPVEALRAD